MILLLLEASPISMSHLRLSATAQFYQLLNLFAPITKQQHPSLALCLVERPIRGSGIAKGGLWDS